MTTPRCKEIWVIFDPLDGPHVFRGKKEAFKQFEKWEREAQAKEWDSFWNMSEPTRYVRAEE